MGCVCCSLGSFVSIMLDALERISLCTVCAMLTCCLLITIITVMVMGIGIGFNYCFVQNSVESMEKAVKAAGAMRSGLERSGPGNIMRSVDRAVQRRFAHSVARREADVASVSNTNVNYTVVTQVTLIMHNFTNISNAVLFRTLPFIIG